MFATLGAFVITLLVVILKFLLPGEADYTRGFAPTWVPILATVVGLIAILMELGWSQIQLESRKLVLFIAWGACVLLLWSSAGIVFDALRVAAVLGIPGLPPVVDWLGFATRTASLMSAALMAASTISFQRITRGSCAVCGQGELAKTRSNTWLGYAAFVLSFPYPLLKIYWSLGGTLWNDQSFGQHSAYGEIVVFGASALLSLALVQKWGKIFPNWMPIFAGKQVPRWLLIIGGWTAFGLTTTVGILAVFGSIMQALGFDGPVGSSGNTLLVSIVYGSWLALGIAFGGATWFYQQQTRKKCLHCGK